MKKHKRMVGVLAKNFNTDPDDLWLKLLYFDNKRFEYIKNKSSIIKNKDVKIVKRLLRKKVNRSELIVEIKAKKQNRQISYNFVIGRKVDHLIYLKKQEVLRIHDELAKDFQKLEDPISPSGLRDEALLDSALFHPMTSYGDLLKYPTVESAGAALLYSLSHNHCFHNGNKRTAIVSLLVFLDKHGMTLNCGEDAVFEISLKLANHKLVEKNEWSTDAEIFEISHWLLENSQIMRKGEKIITFKKLKQILKGFGCIIEDDGRVERRFSKPFFGMPHYKKLKAKLPVEPEGKEVSVILLKKIREDLELDCSNGIDADSFYYGKEFTASEFIDKYRSLLRRLSRY
jgi:death-on-curing family protein